MAGLLATWAADVARVEASAPTTAQLEVSRAALAEWSTGLSEWQAAYLDALRSGDIAVAEQLNSQLSMRREEVANALATDLALVESDASTVIDDLTDAVIVAEASL